MSNFEYFEIQNPDGKMIRGSLHSTSTASPLFIISHGFTGQRMGPDYLFVKLSKILASQGIASVRFDFTGSGESDGDFWDMDFNTMLSDLSTVANHFRTKINPSNLFLLGHSLGGMVTAVSSKSINPDGIVLVSPVAETRRFFIEKQYMTESGSNAFGHFEYGAHEISPSVFDTLQNVNPATFLSENFKGRVLLIQGSSDHTVPVTESELYIKEAAKTALPIEYLLIKDATHNYSRVNDVQELCSTVLSWTKGQF